MASVRIIAPPDGEAPLFIREAWVGLILPLKSNFKPRAYSAPVFGILTGPKSAIGQLFAFLLGRAHLKDFYPVDPIGAIEVLRTKDSDAADWWETNAPHVLRPNRSLGFETEVCELIPD